MPVTPLIGYPEAPNSGRYFQRGAKVQGGAAVLASEWASNGSRPSHGRADSPMSCCLGGVAERSNAAVLKSFVVMA